MLVQTLEKRPYRLDVGRRIGIEHDHVVEIRLHLFHRKGRFAEDLLECERGSYACWT